MSTIQLTERQWSTIDQFLLSDPLAYAGKETSCRGFIKGILWISRSGDQWRVLPKNYGSWNSVYKRFSRWGEHGVWERMFLHFAQDYDMENLLIDSTIIRVHACAAGAPKKTEGQSNKP